MRKIRRKRKNAFKLGVIVFSLIPIALIGSYLSFVDYIIRDLASFTYEIDIDPGEFTPLSDIDPTKLDDSAAIFEERLLKYHIPINLSQETLFDLKGNPIYYLPTDNAGLWTGKMLAAECFRYGSLPDGVQKEQSRILVHKLLTGLSKLIEIPNGGLGPNYSAVIARFYASPEMLADGNWSWLMEDSYKHYNGSGKFSDWRVRLYTSKDELGGYFLGLASALTYASDDPWVSNILKLIIAQITENFIKEYWHEMHGDGSPCGSHLVPYFGSSSEWRLLVMKMACIAFPENERYHQLYDFYATRELGWTNANGMSDYNVIDGYYANSFTHDVILALGLVEDDPVLLRKYVSNYEKSYEIFRNHRNAYYNGVYLALLSKLLSVQRDVIKCEQTSDPSATSGDADNTMLTDILYKEFTPKFNTSLILWDSLDQLWHFYDSGWVPMDTTYGGRNRSYSRQDLYEMTGDENWIKEDPNIAKWRNFFENNSIGKIFAWIPNDLMDGMLDTRYVKPFRSDMYRVANFIWGDNPFDEFGGYTRRKNNYIKESAGSSFTLPYWLLRVTGLISDNAINDTLLQEWSCGS